MWIAASTRDGEEALVLDACFAAPALPPDTLTIVVPRHPQRFDAVAALLEHRGIAFARQERRRRDRHGRRACSWATRWARCSRTTRRPTSRSSAAACVPLGGQNLIEPIAAGVPTLVGPHTFNFAEAAARAIDSGAAMRVSDARDLVTKVGALLRDDAARHAMAQRAAAFHAAHRGTTDRLFAWLAPRLPEA